MMQNVRIYVRFQDCPTESQLKAAQRILRHLKKTGTWFYSSLLKNINSRFSKQKLTSLKRQSYLQGRTQAQENIQQGPDQLKESWIYSLEQGGFHVKLLCRIYFEQFIFYTFILSRTWSCEHWWTHTFQQIVQIQEASSGEEKIKELLDNDDPEITRMWNEDYGMINHPINVIENPAMEVDDVEVQIQEAAGKGSGVLEFENTMAENNLPKEPAHLQQDCPFGVNEDRIASFVGILSSCGNSAIKNNQVQIQEAPGKENGQLELNTFSHIQQHMIPDFANITQEAAGEENGLLGQTVSPFSKIQEFVMLENNVPEMLDTGDTLFELNQRPQEESETLCETEESSFVADLTEALLDHEPLKDISDAIRARK
ncbi:hypothetical protein KY284_020085 [Solanum tuberosum]|nr:hypothetical protein KY284_020085 [Solanum tuberosum]